MSTNEFENTEKERDTKSIYTIMEKGTDEFFREEFEEQFGFSYNDADFFKLYMKKKGMDVHFADGTGVPQYCIFIHLLPNEKLYVTKILQDLSGWPKGEGYKKHKFYKMIERFGWDNMKHFFYKKHLTELEADTIMSDLTSFHKCLELITQRKVVIME